MWALFSLTGLPCSAHERGDGIERDRPVRHRSPSNPLSRVVEASSTRFDRSWLIDSAQALILGRADRDDGQRSPSSVAATLLRIQKSSNFAGLHVNVLCCNKQD